MASIAPAGEGEGTQSDVLGCEPNIRCRGALLWSMIVVIISNSLTRTENAGLIHP